MYFLKRMFTRFFSLRYMAEYVYENGDVKNDTSDLISDLSMNAAVARLDGWGLVKYTVFENIRGNWILKKEKKFA